jgi:hypothetical protein
LFALKIQRTTQQQEQRITTNTYIISDTTFADGISTLIINNAAFTNSTDTTNGQKGRRSTDTTDKQEGSKTTVGPKIEH